MKIWKEFKRFMNKKSISKNKKKCKKKIREKWYKSVDKQGIIATIYLVERLKFFN